MGDNVYIIGTILQLYNTFLYGIIAAAAIKRFKDTLVAVV